MSSKGCACQIAASISNDDGSTAGWINISLISASTTASGERKRGRGARDTVSRAMCERIKVDVQVFLKKAADAAQIIQHGALRGDTINTELD